MLSRSLIINPRVEQKAVIEHMTLNILKMIVLIMAEDSVIECLNLLECLLHPTGLATLPVHKLNFEMPALNPYKDFHFD